MDLEGESARLAELSREQLVGELTRLLEAYRELKDRHDEATEKARLAHELEVHQVELEMQNRELREAHEAIELSRARFARLYDFAPVTYLTLDGKGLILDLNLTGATLFGLDRGSLTGKPLVAIATFEDSGAFFRHLHRALAEGRATSDLAFAINGRRFTVQAVSVREGAPGSAVTLLTALVDVGERKRAEELVRAAHLSEQRLRAGLERLNRAQMAISQALTLMPEHGLDVVLEAIVEQARHLADCDFAALGMGGAADRPFDHWVQRGVSREQAAAIGRNPRPVGLLGLVSRQQAVLRTPKLSEDPRFAGFPQGHPLMTSFLGVPVRYRDDVVGSLYLANKRNAPEFDDDDERLVVLLAERATIAIEAARATSAVRDARSTAEAATQLLAKVGHSLTQLGELSGIPRLLADAAVDHLGADASAVLAMTRDGELEVVASRNLPETVDRFRADPEGIGPELVSHLAEACATRFASGRALPLVSGHDLYAVWVLLFAREGVMEEERLRLAAGLVDLAATAFADVQREAQLEAARAAIARTEKIRTLGQLAAGVSHDLKNVLSPLVLQVELLERTLPAGAKPTRDVVSRMQRLLKRGLDTVDRLRAFGRQEPTPGEPVDLNEVVHECLGLSAERRQRAGGQIELRVECGRPPSVVAEPSELVTSILNLIVNAFDVLPEGGGVVTVRTGEDAGGGWIEVEDDGPGIPTELQRRIFEPSFSTKGKEGTGLGLALVYAFAQRHGGHVTVDSPPDKGARFRIWLPRA